MDPAGRPPAAHEEGYLIITKPKKIFTGRKMTTGTTLNQIQMRKGEKDCPTERIIFITGTLTLLTLMLLFL